MSDQTPGVDLDARIQELTQRKVEANARSTEIMAASIAENRDLTPDEAEVVDQANAEEKALEADIARIAAVRDNQLQLAAPQPRKTQPSQPTDKPPTNPEVTTISAVQRVPKGQAGFDHYGEYCGAVMRASMRGGEVDPRLRPLAAATTYGSEGTGADGGWAVPPDFMAEIQRQVEGEDSLLSRTRMMTSAGNTMTIPIDEATPWASSGGLQTYWDNEAATMSQSKPSLQQVTLKLHKLTALVPITEELMEDSSAIGSWLSTAAPEKLVFAINNALVNGTGVGQPLGILNAPALVSVAKETSQVADTIVAENVIKMWSRMYGPYRRNAVWLVSHDAEPQLPQMVVKVKNVAGSENVGGFGVYMPMGGLSGAPYATLFGRPIINTMAMQTVGDKGDIILAAMDRYLTITKGGGIRAAQSIHLWFDQDVVAFKFTMRVAGQPLLSAAIDPLNGSNTLSSIVTLDARA